MPCAADVEILADDEVRPYHHDVGRIRIRLQENQFR